MLILVLQRGVLITSQGMPVTNDGRGQAPLLFLRTFCRGKEFGRHVDIGVVSNKTGLSSRCSSSCSVIRVASCLILLLLLLLLLPPFSASSDFEAIFLFLLAWCRTYSICFFDHRGDRSSSSPFAPSESFNDWGGGSTTIRPRGRHRKIPFRG